MQLKLRILVGNSAGRCIAVASPTFLIGRADDCALRPKSELISRRHCELAQHESWATVRDLNSRTGTWVNGVRIPIDRKLEVRAGDQVKIGPLEFAVVFAADQEEKTRPAVSPDETTTISAAETNTDLQADVAQWLAAENADLSIDDAAEAAPGARTIVSAAEFMSPAAAATETQESGAAAPAEKVDPRLAAVEALKRHMRRL